MCAPLWHERVSVENYFGVIRFFMQQIRNSARTAKREVDDEG